MNILQKIKDFFKVGAERGLNLPLAYDASKNGPSITLLIFYFAMLLTVGSLIAFHLEPDKLLQPALLTLTFLAMAFVFYRLRSLDKVKLDLDDKTIELEGDDDENKSGTTGGSSNGSGTEKPNSEGK